MGLDSQAISNVPCQQSGPAGGVVSEPCASPEKKGKGWCGAVSSMAKGLIMLSGPAALVGFVLGKEKIAAIASVVFEKLSLANSHVVGTIVSNFSAFSTGVLGAGLFNLLDGYRGLKASSKSLNEVNEKLKTLTEGSDEHQAFSKLKQLHQGKRNRSVLQSLIGVAATVVGGVALAGVLANPYALLAVGVIAGTVLVGAQVHKWLNNGKIRQIEEKWSPRVASQQDENPQTDASASYSASPS